jgi:HSP20 family molecular chaperone IbpA
MSDTKELATRPSTETEPKGRESQFFLRPPADISEDADGITLILDMPGVSKERLSVQTDKNMLVVEGDVQLTMAEGMEALYAEIHSTHYRRSFALSGELDAESAEAGLKDGVLTVRIPRRSELRPRRIEVKGA